jgi:hypothetical protein
MGVFEFIERDEFDVEQFDDVVIHVDQLLSFRMPLADLRRQ